MFRPMLYEYFIIFLSFVTALILTIVPLPPYLALFRPHWVILLLILWIMHFPSVVGLKAAWVLGLILDSLQGTLIGQNAFALVIVAFMSNYFHRKLRLFLLLQQIPIVLLLIVIYEVLVLWIQGMIGQINEVYGWWQSLLSSLLIWPLLKLILTSLLRPHSIDSSA